MKVVYGNRVNVLMMANMLHVRFVGRNRGGSTSVLRSGNTCVLLHPSVSNVQIQILSLNKQTNVYTNVIEISVILIKQSLYD